MFKIVEHHRLRKPRKKHFKTSTPYLYLSIFILTKYRTYKIIQLSVADNHFISMHGVFLC